MRVKKTLNAKRTPIYMRQSKTKYPLGYITVFQIIIRTQKNQGYQFQQNYWFRNYSS
jgi:hypothetical protein